MRDHAFDTRTEAVDSTPATSFFAGCSAASLPSLLGPLRIRLDLYGYVMWRRPLWPEASSKVLEVAVFREDIVERLVHNIVGGCVDESGMIGLFGGRFVQANDSTDIADLVDFK